jgi:predicted nucleotidyltransferase
MLGEVATIIPAGFSRGVAEVLPEAVQRLVQDLQPEKIILFGSYAYGAPTPDSDVDLLIITDIGGSATERYLTASSLLYPRPFPVDLLVKTPREVELALQAGDYFVREILARGRVLYDRRS